MEQAHNHKVWAQAYEDHKEKSLQDGINQVRDPVTVDQLEKNLIESRQALLGYWDLIDKEIDDRLREHLSIMKEIRADIDKKDQNMGKYVKEYQCFKHLTAKVQDYRDKLKSICSEISVSGTAHPCPVK